MAAVVAILWTVFRIIALADEVRVAFERDKPTPPGGEAAKILIVMVRYGTLLQDSKTMRTLGECFAEDAALIHNFSILVWDNTPLGQAVPELPFPIEYRHNGENVG